MFAAQPIPHTAAEVRATAVRLRTKASAMRRFSNDPGAEQEHLKPSLRAGARYRDALARHLDTVADD